MGAGGRYRPRVAILGAGPVGLDAALAAAERGWPFVLHEAGDRAGAAVAQWGHVRMFSPWSMDVSPRMRRVLEAAGRQVPGGSGCPTGRELVERVLRPLASLGPVAAGLRTGSRAVSVSRDGLLKDDAIGQPERGERPFRLLIRSRGEERVERADVVLDCTGTWSAPNALGSGGIPAPGEAAAEDLIVRHVPDVEADPDSWANRRVLLVGAGHSAWTAIRALAPDGTGRRPSTLIWAIRGGDVPVSPDPEDPLPERRRLGEEVLARVREGALDVRRRTAIERLEPLEGGAALRVTLSGAEGGRVDVDRVLSLTGYVGDASLYRQLQVHECYATSGPMKLAASLLDSRTGDCLDEPAWGPEALRNPEPDFFLLGSKSYGRNNTFLLQEGWRQVDQVMGLLEAESARWPLSPAHGRSAS